MSKAGILHELGFVRLEGGPVVLGTEQPLPCRFEGYRHNEVPMRRFEVGSFWIAKHCVTNWEYERCDRRHRRPLTAPDDRHPATDVTYLNALNYCQWLSEQRGIKFALPTEAQWVFAAAPHGQQFPWGDKPSKKYALTRGPDINGPIHVDDMRFGPNWCGLCHISGNVSQYVLGAHHASGHNGAASDGYYCLVKGGNWLHCPWSTGVQRRGIIDVAARISTVGFRLVVND